MSRFFTPVLRRALIVALAVLILDRITKIWVVDHLDLPSVGRIAVADPWLNLVMAWNQGVNFGLFDLGDSGRYWLSGLAIAIVIGVAIWARTMRGWPAAIGAGLVIGGALGNVWDRLKWGAVADFLNMSCCGINNPFAFNIADAAIFAGAMILILMADGGDGGSRARRRKTA